MVITYAGKKIFLIVKIFSIAKRVWKEENIAHNSSHYILKLRHFMCQKVKERKLN